MSLRSTSLFESLPSHLVLAGALVMLAACGSPEGGEESGGDGADASFGAVSGKADGSGPSQCQLDTLLTELHGPLSDFEELRAVGVHTRAAKSISAHILGPDGSLGTFDDGTIETLEELDALKYVGPAALEQLLEIPAVAQASCGAQVQAEVIFSPQPSDATHTVRAAQEIDRAQHTLDVAMYSFSNNDVFRAIERAIERGVKVRVIFESANKDKSDPAGTMSARLEEIGADVRYINKIMHHKFALVDGPRYSFEDAKTGMFMSGSANWSNSAGTRYDENTVFIKGSEELNMRFQREFNLLWDHSRDLEWGLPKLWEKSERLIEDAHINDSPFVDAAFTSANFRTTFSSRYGETFSRVRGRSAVAEFIVDQIEQADTSILIASGHLRSRPIAEALIAKRQADPNIEIRVYLDGQEFISEWWHNKQLDDLDACLVSAGTSATKTEDCYDKGFYFGYELGQSGIDVRYKTYSYRWHYRTAEQMHHKYLIFDNDTVIQGSYNLSDNAEHNTMENMVLFTGAPFADLTAHYIANFESMWKTGREEELYSDLMEDINAAPPGTTIPIVFDSMSLTWDQVDAYKNAVRDRCPAINSADYRDNPDKRFTCKLPD